jgi:hypothetical protein
MWSYFSIDWNTFYLVRPHVYYLLVYGTGHQKMMVGWSEKNKIEKNAKNGVIRDGLWPGNPLNLRSRGFPGPKTITRVFLLPPELCIVFSKHARDVARCSCVLMTSSELPTKVAAEGGQSLLGTPYI